MTNVKTTTALIVGLPVLFFIGLVLTSVEAQQKPASVLIWCQDGSGNQAPCQGGNVLDYDTGGGTVNQGTVGLVLPGSGGPVAGGTASNPVRIDPTGTTPQPVTASSLPLPTGAATEASVDGLEALLGTSNTNTSNTASGVGGTGDAAATPGGAGSVSSKLRLLTDLVNQVLTELGQKTEPANTQLVGDGTGPLTVDGTVGATQSGTWTVQPGNTANTTPWLTSPTPATSGGVSTCYLSSAATTNSTNCKASAGQIYGYDVINTTTTIYFLRLYNSASAPTCSSATGFIRSIPVPPASAAGGAGGIARSSAVGQAYGTGIGFCLTGGGSSSDNTSAETGVYIAIDYK